MSVAGDECPFCREIEEASPPPGLLALALLDAHPVSEGHLLVVSTRHVARIDELGTEEWEALFSLVRVEVSRMVLEEDIDGINIGCNSGGAAGQTVDHAHVHLIPRREGDCDDPSGGIRRIIAADAGDWRDAVAKERSTAAAVKGADGPTPKGG